MTIDEAISHALEVAERQEYLSTQNHGYCEEKWNVKAREQCAECAADHRQLAEWLTELKELKALVAGYNPADIQTLEMLLARMRNQNNNDTNLCELCDKEVELKEAKRLLKLAVEDFKAVNSNMLTCRYCKHYDAGIDDCGLSDDDSACEDICGWRYADEVRKLINDEKITNVK